MKSGRLAGEKGAAILLPEVRYEPLPRQVINLAFLSDQLPSSLISEQLAQSLSAESTASVILVRLEPQDGRGVTNDGIQPEVFLNGEFHMPSELQKTDAGFFSFTLGVRSDPPTPAGVISLVEQLTRQFRHVLIETRVTDSSAPWFRELLLRSDLTYLFLGPTPENISRLDVVMRGARAQGLNPSAQVKPIVCLAEGEQMDGLDMLAQRVGSPIHFFVRNCPRLNARTNGSLCLPAGTFRTDIRRLAREIGGCLVGLALSSGAAKGFSHIGVIQVLEENGIEVDVVAGASMGAYVGALWAYGCDGRELERLARELEGRWRLWSLIDPVFPPRRGFLRGFAVKRRLMRTLEHARFSDMVRPLRVVAANLATLERVVFSGGEVATAVHASIAVPGICVPVSLDGETYTDGGIVDPLPVDVLREMGVSKVIAVNVIPTPDRIRFAIQAQLEQMRQNDAAKSSVFSKVIPIDQQVNYFARGNLLEILMRSVHGAQIRMAEASCLLADLVVRPEIYDDCWMDYRHPGKFIALGREAAERHLDEIKSLVSRKEPAYEQPLAPEPMAEFI